MADTALWRDTTAVLIADATQITGTAEALLWTQDKLSTAYLQNYWSKVGGAQATGKTVKITAAGKITSAASTPGNITLGIRAGTTTAGTLLATSAATSLVASKTNISWNFDAYVTCTAIGATGKLRAYGKFWFDGAGGLFTTAAQNPLMLPATSPAADTTFDTTGVSGLVLTATLGSASDLMTLTHCVVEALN